MTERLVVIGADAAGMSAASQARRRRSADDLEIVAFDLGHFTSYSACGIPYWVAGYIEDRERLIARTPETFREKYDIDVRLRTEVVEIDTDAGKVVAVDHERDERYELGYDQLMIATGATPRRPPLEGADGDGIHGVQTLDDGQRILDDLKATEPRNAVVVGGGYIGLEMAEAMTERGIHVSLVDLLPQPMPTLDPDMGVLITDAMRSLGIECHCGTPAEGFELDAEGRVRAVVAGGEELPADIVFLGLGVRPNSGLAREADIPVGDGTGAVAVDRRQRTSVDGVWSAGDCAEAFHRVSGEQVAFALGTIANKQGRVAGINLGGGYETFPGVVGTAVTKICGAEIARTGLNEAEATGAGFEFVAETVESTTRAGYFPGSRHLTMKVIAERRSGRLLGAQIVGEEGAAKRIDVFATALWNEMSVEELLNVDLSYAPPFSPVWDPVLIAARKAWQAVEDDIAP